MGKKIEISSDDFDKLRDDDQGREASDFSIYTDLKVQNWHDRI